MSVCLERLRKLRDEKGETQEEVAKHLNISRTAMVKIETGSRNIGPDLLYSLARYYGTSSDYLLGLTEVRRAGETLPACDELGISDTATAILEELNGRGRYGRILSKMIEHEYFEEFLLYAENASLPLESSSIETSGNIQDLIPAAKAAGYSLIPATQKKHYNVYMASVLMQSMLYDICDTIVRLDKNAD